MFDGRFIERVNVETGEVQRLYESRVDDGGFNAVFRQIRGRFKRRVHH